MEEKYRRIICPNGHYSMPVRENEPLPRRCRICRQQYLKVSKPVWCDKDGNEILNNSIDDLYDIGQKEGQHKKINKITSPKDHNFEIQKEENPEPVRRRKRIFLGTEVDNVNVENVRSSTNTETIFLLQTGPLTITLKGEGIIGRENTGAEILSVNRLISREHCYFIVTKQKGLQIRDAGSMNGTYADTGCGRTAIDSITGTFLKNGDRLWLADMLFEVKEV